MKKHTFLLILSAILLFSSQKVEAQCTAPVATASPSSQTVCSGSSCTILLTGDLTGTSFTWTAAQTGATGASVGAGPSIFQTLVATGSANGTAVYTITPTAAGCVGTPITVIVTINPNPVVTATPALQTINSGTTTSISLSGSTPGTTFSWTVSQSGASGASPGNGSAIAQLLLCTGTASGTVVYTITPNANGCTGDPIVVTVSIICATSVNENKLASALSVYPNPGHGKYYFKLPENMNGSELNVNVYNVLGEIILNSKTTNSQFQIDLSNQPNGIYIIRVFDSNQSFNQRLIKQ